MTHDPIATAHLMRAEKAIGDALAGYGRPATVHQKAAAFIAGAFEALRVSPHDLHRTLSAHANPLVQKASAHVLSEWGGGDAAPLASAFIATVAELSLFDQIARYGRVIPAQVRRVMVASGAVGDIVAEGDPKVVRRLQLNLAGPDEASKAVGMVVLTRELVDAGGPAVMRMFEDELTRTVLRAMNRAILGRIVDSSAIAVGSTGSAIGDLRAGLAAAPASDAFVVTGPTGFVAELATDPGNRGGMSVRGGEFIPGISVVAVDDETAVTVIPASRFAIRDHGMQVRSADHATVDMRDTPQSPAQQVSLWQTGSVGLIIERFYDLVPSPDPVVIVS